MNNDTICALSTAVGGAMAIVRVSGNDAISIVDKVFSKDITNAKGNTLHYGYIRNTIDSGIIDEVVAAIFRSPHSYTGEDSIEINCHGSQYIVKTIIELLLDCGCRLAEPGEFTMRAFMNGKMDLSQAEAVADLIASTNQATHDIAIGQLKGHFSSELKHLRKQLLRLTSLLELELDFSDHEDLEFADRKELMTLTQQIYSKISRLAYSFKIGKAIKNGIPVAIVGQTNVGKSTLLNCFVEDERAIVSDIHGTTRDTIEEIVDINGVAFRFIDTAGLRYTEDEIEQIGIERTYKKISEARIIIWMTDRKPTRREIDEMEELCYGKELIVVENKCDLKNSQEREQWMCPMSYISAKENIGIEELKQTIYKAANIPAINENDVIVTNARHYEALTRAQHNLESILTKLKNQTTSDLIAEDLKIVLEDLAEITGGAITTPETLTNIFQNFCIGK